MSPSPGTPPTGSKVAVFGTHDPQTMLGTVGSGNHYVDVLADELGRIWVGVHFGSRGFGHTVASGFLALGQNRPWGTRVPEAEVLLDLKSPTGEAYWELMNLAGQYAYAGREWVARKVVDMLGGRELDLVHNHHNFAWRENHDGQDLIVVRKGATPAFPGQRGFVGGSMGDDAVIIEGAPGDTATQHAALYSTVHGAGDEPDRGAREDQLEDEEDSITREGELGHAARLDRQERRHPARRRAGRESARLPAAARRALSPG